MSWNRPATFSYVTEVGQPWLLSRHLSVEKPSHRVRTDPPPSPRIDRRPKTPRNPTPKAADPVARTVRRHRPSVALPARDHDDHRLPRQQLPIIPDRVEEELEHPIPLHRGHRAPKAYGEGHVVVDGRGVVAVPETRQSAGLRLSLPKLPKLPKPPSRPNRPKDRCNPTSIKKARDCHR